MTHDARQRKLLLFCFLLPGMAYLCLLRIVPVFFTIWLSFNEWNLTEGGGPVFSGLDNYNDLFEDHAFLSAFGRTALFTLAATTIELLLGTPSPCSSSASSAAAAPFAPPY